MGGKRPDQVHLQASATDYKTRTDDKHIHEEDKQALQSRPSSEGIPPSGENPALSDVKSRKSANRKAG